MRGPTPGTWILGLAACDRTVGTGYGRRGCAWSTCSWSVIQTDTAAGTIGSYSPYENRTLQPSGHSGSGGVSR